MLGGPLCVCYNVGSLEISIAPLCAMPGMRVFGRRWHVATDEFVLSSMASCVFEAFWFVAPHPSSIRTPPVNCILNRANRAQITRIRLILYYFTITCASIPAPHGTIVGSALCVNVATLPNSRTPSPIMADQDEPFKPQTRA